MAKAIVDTTRSHFTRRWPGSKHYDPNKVYEGDSLGTMGQVIIDVPGVTRAYKDIDIYPKIAKALTIPMHQAAYGKSARSFDDLFVVKKNDKAFLAQGLADGSLQFMYLLCKHVHQNRDSSILPSDDTYAKAMYNRIIHIAHKAISEATRNV